MRRGVLVTYAHLLLSLVSLMVLTPVILKHVGPTAYGLWAMLSSVVTYLSLFDMGLSPALAKYTAEYRALGEKQELSRIASTTFVTFAVVGAVMLLTALTASPWIDSLLKVPDELRIVSRVSFLLMAANVVALLFLGIFANIVYGHQRIDIWKTFGIVQIVANLLLTILFLTTGLGIIGVACASLGSTLLVTVLYIVFLSQSGYAIQIRMSFASINVLKRIGPFSLRTMLLGLSSKVLYYSDYLVIGFVIGSAQVTPYEIAYKSAFLLTYLFSVISTAMLPKVSELDALKETDSLRILLTRLTSISMLIAVPSCLCLFFVGPLFISWWVGSENFVGQKVIFVFALMNLLHAVGTPTGMLLQAGGRNSGLLVSEIFRAGLHVALSIFMVERIALLGVACAGLLAQALTSGWIVPRLACRLANLRPYDLFKDGVLRPFAVGVMLGGVVWPFRDSLLNGEGIKAIGVSCFVLVLAYAVLYVVFGATKAERAWCVRLGCRWVNAFARFTCFGEKGRPSSRA